MAGKSSYSRLKVVPDPVRNGAVRIPDFSVDNLALSAGLDSEALLYLGDGRFGFTPYDLKPLMRGGRFLGIPLTPAFARVILEFVSGQAPTPKRVEEIIPHLGVRFSVSDNPRSVGISSFRSAASGRPDERLTITARTEADEFSSSLLSSHTLVVSFAPEQRQLLLKAVLGFEPVGLDS